MWALSPHLHQSIDSIIFPLHIKLVTFGTVYLENSKQHLSLAISVANLRLSISAHQDLSVNVIHVFDFHCTYTYIVIFIHINLLQYLSPKIMFRLLQLSILMTYKFTIIIYTLDLYIFTYKVFIFFIFYVIQLTLSLVFGLLPSAQVFSFLSVLIELVTCWNLF